MAWKRLSKEQRKLRSAARAAGTSEQGVPLDDARCGYLIARVAADLDLAGVTEGEAADLYTAPLDRLRHPLPDVKDAYGRLVGAAADAETYFDCLARLLKSRLKYQRILETQSLPTMDAVGPRALLQYGLMPDPALAHLLFWRKWLYDIDNRSGQETGNLFEPILAAAIGGQKFGGGKSPVKRDGKPGGKGRQVDCLIDESDGERVAYEFKVRITIAASGQGRWGEELSFPADARLSGYKPVLAVLDPTPNPKLDEICRVYAENGGTHYCGDAAWGHFEERAGRTMATFIEKYVRGPVDRIVEAAPDVEDGGGLLDPLLLIHTADAIEFRVGDHAVRVPRHPPGE